MFDSQLAPLLVGTQISDSSVTDSIRIEFYREEFVKHRECLRCLRGTYSDCAIVEMERALREVMARVDKLCARGETDLDHVVSALLCSLDDVTKLSACSDSSLTH